MKTKSAVTALLLSVMPGLGQLYIGKRKKALGLLIIDTGILITFTLSSSYIMRLLMIIIYIVTFFPACIESYHLAKYGKNTLDTGAKWYVTILLLTTGFSALPLLWQSEKFSKGAKINWTITVPVLAVIFFTVLIKYWDLVNAYIEQALF